MIKKLIKIDNLCKSYKYRNLKFSILENIRFEIKENEIISIIGPSGVGKSTFLNLLGLLDSFDSGEYYFDDYHFHPENQSMGFCSKKNHEDNSIIN